MEFRHSTEHSCNGSETDHGPEPYAANVMGAARRNQNFRTAFWTGSCLQMTLMNIPPCSEIGLEIHPDTDQVIHVEEGRGLVRMGTCREKLDFQRRINQGDTVFVPCGTWHNVLNIGNCPLKLSSIYAPPQHPKGTVHRTKKDAAEQEKDFY